MTHHQPPPDREQAGGWPPQPPVSGHPYPQPGYPPQPEPRRRIGPGWIIALVVGCVVLLLAVGVGIAVSGARHDGNVVTFVAPSAGDPTTATGDPAAFGLPPGATLTVTADDDGVTEVTIVSVKVRDGGCGQYAPNPDNGTYVVADVRVLQKQGVGAINPLFFTYVADDGTTANAMSGAFSGCDKNALGSTNELRSGARRSGQVVFDAPAGSGTIEFEPGGWGGDAVGSWKVG